MKTILFIDQGDFIGGAEFFNLDLLEALSQNAHNNYLLYTSGNPEYTKRVPKNVQVIQGPLPSLKLNPTGIFAYLKSIIRLGQVLKRYQVEAVHSNTVRGHMIASPACFIGGVPLIWMLHDTSFHKRFIRLFSGIPRFILPVSQYIHHHYKLDLAKSKADIHIFPNGFFLDRFSKKTAPKSVQNIIMLGRIDYWKGQHIAIEAMQILKDKGFTLRLDIWGHTQSENPQSQAYIDTIRTQVKNSPNANLQWLSQEPVEKLLPNYDLCLHTSTQPEPFGRTIIEAMAAGIPVICSNIGAPKDIVQHEKNGLIHKAGSAQDLAKQIERLKNDPELLQNLHKQGLQTAKEYDINALAVQYENVVAGI